jgi:hypothetical protein
LHKSINTIEMSALKKIAVVVGIGTVIGVVYYFLKKSKPTIAQDQLTELATDTVTPIEENLAPTPSIEEQLQIDKCMGLSRLECEQLIAKLDKEKAEANGTTIVSTYISNDAPRTSTLDTRDGISYNTGTNTGINTATGNGAGTGTSNPRATSANPTTTASTTTTTSGTSNPRTTSTGTSTPRTVTASGGRRG